MTSPLTDENIELISSKVSEKVLASLPALLRDMMKDNITGVVKECLPQILENVRTERETSTQVMNEARSFMRVNRNILNENYRMREKRYEQHTRCHHLMKLYDDCREETPPYIPKKFREDKYFVRNERELEKVFNRSMSNMQCEYDILTIRKDDFKEEFEAADIAVRTFVEQQNIAQNLK